MKRPFLFCFFLILFTFENLLFAQSYPILKNHFELDTLPIASFRGLGYARMTQAEIQFEAEEQAQMRCQEKNSILDRYEPLEWNKEKIQDGEYLLANPNGSLLHRRIELKEQQSWIFVPPWLFDDHFYLEYRGDPNRWAHNLGHTTILTLISLFSLGAAGDCATGTLSPDSSLNTPAGIFFGSIGLGTGYQGMQRISDNYKLHYPRLWNRFQNWRKKEVLISNFQVLSDLGTLRTIPSGDQAISPLLFKQIWCRSKFNSENEEFKEPSDEKTPLLNKKEYELEIVVNGFTPLSKNKRPLILEWTTDWVKRQPEVDSEYLLRQKIKKTLANYHFESTFQRIALKRPIANFSGLTRADALEKMKAYLKPDGRVKDGVTLPHAPPENLLRYFDFYFLNGASRDPSDEHFLSPDTLLFVSNVIPRVLTIPEARVSMQNLIQAFSGISQDSEMEFHYYFQKTLDQLNDQAPFSPGQPWAPPKPEADTLDAKQSNEKTKEAIKTFIAICAHLGHRVCQSGKNEGGWVLQRILKEKFNFQEQEYPQNDLPSIIAQELLDLRENIFSKVISTIPYDAQTSHTANFYRNLLWGELGIRQGYPDENEDCAQKHYTQDAFIELFFGNSKSLDSSYTPRAMANRIVELEVRNPKVLGLIREFLTLKTNPEGALKWAASQEGLEQFARLSIDPSSLDQKNILSTFVDFHYFRFSKIQPQDQELSEEGIRTLLFELGYLEQR